MCLVLFINGWAMKRGGFGRINFQFTWILIWDFNVHFTTTPAMLYEPLLPPCAFSFLIISIKSIRF
jgi:hypothetical protein